MNESELSLADHGVECHPAVLSEAETSQLRDLCDRVIGKRPGARLYALPALDEALAGDGKIGRLAQKFLGSSGRAVRAVVFDKSPDVNWALGWHQDRTIAVQRRIDVPGFGSWTVKAGAVHVEPPFEITRQMVTLRVHLDEVDPDNAPLLVAPGSHHLGRIPTSRITATVASLGSLPCLAKSGDVWIYSTSILHASDAARLPRRRRVLQLDFSAEELPGGLQWLGSTMLNRLK